MFICLVLLILVVLHYKGDIITSLRSRLDIVSDETDGDSTLDVEIEASNVMSNVPTPHLTLHELRSMFFSCIFPSYI